jgi:predicted aminopeptidase
VHVRWLLLCFCLSGCLGSRYLAQAVAGQAALLDARRPLESVIKDKKTPPHVRALLAEVPRMKAYASAHGLAPTKNYERYVPLARDAAVWVVSATPQLSFKAKTWWFPVVGEVPYLGWFALDDARAFANELKATGLDVSLRPASAFSTLGFFEDPILSTMLSEDVDAAGDLANTLFHESLHATLYIHGRTDISEGIASFVGDQLARDYLSDFHDAAALEAYEAAARRAKRRLAQLLSLKEALMKLYASGADDPGKMKEKGRLLMQAQIALRLRRAIGNATLAELSRYSSGEEELERLLARKHRDWRAFIAVLREWIRRGGPLAFSDLDSL